jgi:SAM-dependent methyltransferase
MLKPKLTVVLLLALSAGVMRLDNAPAANTRLVMVAAIAVTAVAFLFFGHIELALAAMTPIALSFTATIGLFGWFGARLDRADIAAVLIGLSPAMSLSLLLLSGYSRGYRHLRRYGRWARALLVTMWIEIVVFLWLLARYTGAASSLFHCGQLLGSLVGVVSVLSIVPAAGAFLLPHDRNRLAPGFGQLRGNSLTRTRSLYRYLDISAEQYVAWKLRLDPIFGHIDHAVPSAATILDAGCGFGIMSNLLTMDSPGRHVVGIDFDSRKLRIARRAARTLRNVRFVAGDLLDAAFPPADCVLLIDALHYWTAEKQTCIIARCAACLRPGGKLIFREGMRSESAGHRVVHWAERGAVWLGHNPRGDGLCFQSREFYLEEFARHGLEVQCEPSDWGRGSNTVLILARRQ